MDPNNEVAWEIFQETASQARVAGLGGVVGYETATLPFLFTVYQVPEQEWLIIFKKLNAIWSVALPIWNKPKDQPK